MSDSPRTILISRLKDRIRDYETRIAELRHEQRGMELALNQVLETLPTPSLSKKER